MNYPQQLRTPTKSKNLPLLQDLRYIVSVERPRPSAIDDQLNQDHFQNSILFLTKEKQQPSEDPEFLFQESDPVSHQSEPSSDPQPDPETKYQTVKKQFESTILEKECIVPTTARQNVKEKGCNCDKSKCQLKYCVCFKMGKVCTSECECIGCENHEVTSQHKQNEKIAQELLSNSKQRGCNCKNSNCLKKYCVCHQNGNKCSKNCRCENCHNLDENSREEREEEMDAVRLMFSTRKRIKISEFELEENKENMGMNY